MWELDYKESWVLKNWCFWTVVLEKTLESPLDCKEIQPVHPKGNQFWIFIGRSDAETEIPILWPPDMKNWLIWKDPGAGKDWGQEEKGMTEDEMLGWHHWLNGHGFRWWTGRPGVLRFMGLQSRTWLSNWTELNWFWERLLAGGAGDDRGWDGWMASPTWWIWVTVSSGSWWWTGKPCVLQFMGSPGVRHTWVTELILFIGI